MSVTLVVCQCSRATLQYRQKGIGVSTCGIGKDEFDRFDAAPSSTQIV